MNQHKTLSVIKKTKKHLKITTSYYFGENVIRHFVLGFNLIKMFFCSDYLWVFYVDENIGKNFKPRKSADSSRLVAHNQRVFL